MKKKYFYLFQLCWLTFMLVSCGMHRRGNVAAEAVASPTVLRLADSILQRGLDHEALYTLIGSIKTISSVASFAYPLANTDMLAKRLAAVVDPVVDRPYLDSLRAIQQAVKVINQGIPDVKLIMSPFKATYEGKRIVQVYAVRVSLLDSLLEAEERFFGQFGLVPGSDPGVVVNTIEYVDKYERLRGYGYLFGYPGYAVDFFVEAFHQSDTSGKQVERDFFQIPVHTGEEGHFVYAIPKGHKPSADIDSVRYHRAMHVLESYRAVREKYVNPVDSTLKAILLLHDYHGVN